MTYTFFSIINMNVHLYIYICTPFFVRLRCIRWVDGVRDIVVLKKKVKFHQNKNLIKINQPIKNNYDDNTIAVFV